MPGFLGRASSIIRKFSDATKTKENIIQDGYKIVTATDDDMERVLALMRKSFFKDEPSILGCGIRLNNLCDALQRLMVGDLSNGRSLLAVSKTDRLLSACLTGEMLTGTGDYLRKMAHEAAGDTRSARLVRFWNYLLQTARLPEALGLPRMWEVYVIATDPPYRRLGIAKELTAQSRELARKFGFPAMCVFCTGEYSAKMCRSLRMRHFLDIPYSDYRDVRDRQIVTPPPPHQRVAIYIEDLSGGGVSTTIKTDVPPSNTALYPTQ